MAKKALFHLVRFQDGHRKWKEVQAAGSKTAIGTAERSPHARAEVEKAIGWHAVKAFPNLISPHPQLDVCCSPANSFFFLMFP
ncbi:hypothetical protein [Xanthomonas melonis]|uniref:hypothetical protein n=1 Tax=Xanthomonas melonis TaxID=56456 RepID=UPI003EBAE265